MIIKIGPNEKGQSVEKYIKKLMKDVPLGAIYKAFRKGDIRLNKLRAKEKDRLEEGDELEIKYLESRKAETKKEFMNVAADFKIVFEDKNILMIEKWPGVLVHPDGREEASLTDYVLTYLSEKEEYNRDEETTFSPSPVNRLDMNTSGIIIFAKNYESLKSLNAIMKNGDLRKDYVAIVKGRIKDGKYDAFIEKDEEKNTSMIYEEAKEGRQRVSMEVKTLETVGSYSFIELNLITGRSHQLRAHLKYLGNPIVGDTKYGLREINDYFFNKYGLSFQYLYAYKVTFKGADDYLSYMLNKTIAVKLPPLFRTIKNDLFKVNID